jgi:hypothetical protein
MSIETGLAIGCTDVQAVGGIQRVYIRKWNSNGNNDQVVINGGNHTVDSIADSNGTSSSWGIYETKIETADLQIAGTSENGVSTYECTLTFMLPNTDLTKLTRLQQLTNEPLMVIAVDSNGNPNTATSAAGSPTHLVLGISNTLTGSDQNLDVSATSHSGFRPQTFARIASIEGGTGAAFADQNGVTVTITCTQYELPRTYVNADAVTVSGTGATFK